MAALHSSADSGRLPVGAQIAVYGVNQIAMPPDAAWRVSATTAMELRVESTGEDASPRWSIDLTSRDQKVRPTDRVRGLIVAPDGQHVIAAVADRVLALASATGSVTWEHVPPRSFGFLVVSPTSIVGDAARVFAAFDNGTIIEWSYEGRLNRLWHVPECPRLLGIGLDFLYGCDGHYLNAWRVDAAEPGKPPRVSRTRMPDRTFAISTAPNAHRVATRSLHTVDVWEASADGSALTPVSRFNIGTGLPLLALHPSGQVV
ncbi:MAG: hypothetical protein SFX74_11350, partial [Fimbriimonadaceae bacterium]|nr:hypothetical protein [Fimbriimonadaceae bacterium]